MHHFTLKRRLCYRTAFLHDCWYNSVIFYFSSHLKNLSLLLFMMHHMSQQLCDVHQMRKKRKEFSDVCIKMHEKRRRRCRSYANQIKLWLLLFKITYTEQTKRMIMLEFSLLNPIFSSIKQKFHIYRYVYVAI